MFVSDAWQGCEVRASYYPCIYVEGFRGASSNLS